MTRLLANYQVQYFYPFKILNERNINDGMKSVSFACKQTVQRPIANEKLVSKNA